MKSIIVTALLLLGGSAIYGEEKASAKVPSEVPAVKPVPDSAVKKLDLKEVFIVVKNYQRIYMRVMFPDGHHVTPTFRKGETAYQIGEEQYFDYCWNPSATPKSCPVGYIGRLYAGQRVTF
jgi:hypothetical protein